MGNDEPYKPEDFLDLDETIGWCYQFHTGRLIATGKMIQDLEARLLKAEENNKLLQSSVVALDELRQSEKEELRQKADRLDRRISRLRSRAIKLRKGVVKYRSLYKNVIKGYGDTLTFFAKRNDQQTRIFNTLKGALKKCVHALGVASERLIEPGAVLDAKKEAAKTLEDVDNELYMPQDDIPSLYGSC